MNFTAANDASTSISPPLHGVLAEIAEATSLETMLCLVAAYGGTRVYVPKCPKPKSPLVAAVGMAEARAITALYGGELIHVPRLSRSRYAAALAETERLLVAGLSQEKVARKLGVDRVTVQRRARKLRAMTDTAARTNQRESV